MFRGRRHAKPVLALVALSALALVATGCAFIKPGSLKVSQEGGIGSARVHFELCTLGNEDFCGPNSSSATFQYLAGIAVPPGSVPPTTFTATPIKGGAPIVFTRNDEVATEMAAFSAALQKTISELTDPEDIEDAKQLEQIIGGPWPPSGLQGVGYLSAPTQEVKEQAAEWAVDVDFGLPTAANGGPFPGPFATAVAIGLREASPAQPENRPVRCARFDPEVEPGDSEALCSGSVQQAQVGTADLKILAPKKPAPAFVGGSGELTFPLKFAATNGTVPTFALSATTTAKGGKAKPTAGKFTPGTPDPTTHLAPNATGKVKVTVPRKIKPGTYTVTLTATAPQGGTATQVGKLKVTKPKLKFGKLKLNPAKGTATLKIKVPGAGKLTIAGKGLKKVKKKSKKAKTLKLKIVPGGGTSALLGRAGSAKVKLKATFKPTSGISVSKKKSVVLKLR